MAQQKSLLLLEPKGSFAVGTTEIPKPDPSELLVKVQATALNPADWKIQKYGFVIQLAKLSGFSPIIATASPHNIPFLTSLGATHIIDRRASFSALQSSISSLSSSPLQIVYDAVSSEDTQQAGYDLLAPSGSIVLVNPSIKTQEDSGKKIVQVFGMTQDPNQRGSGKSLFSKLTELLEAGDIKPIRVEVLPNGLHGIIDGLKRLEEDAISGYKLIVHPQETDGN